MFERAGRLFERKIRFPDGTRLLFERKCPLFESEIRFCAGPRGVSGRMEFLRWWSHRLHGAQGLLFRRMGLWGVVAGLLCVVLG